MIDIISNSPLILSEGLKTIESNLKKAPSRDTQIIRNSILAGFCLLTGALLLSFGAPWPAWTIIFIFAIIFALRS
jgi:hypothetical protein